MNNFFKSIDNEKKVKQHNLWSKKFFLYNCQKNVEVTTSEVRQFSEWKFTNKRFFVFFAKKIKTKKINYYCYLLM